MPTARYLVAATVTGNYLFVAGGVPSPSKVFELYSIQTDTWKTGALARSASGPVVLGATSSLLCR
jgi:hypothetical protein